jgi:hypothetical protein
MGCPRSLLAFVIVGSPKGDEQSRAASRPSQAALDCFRSLSIGPRDFARVRWLATTSSLAFVARFLRLSLVARQEARPPEVLFQGEANIDP